MKNRLQLHALLGNTDIYLVDQILKGRYHANDMILDAGCGGGRNLHWFLQNEIIIYGTDINEAAIEQLQEHYSSVPRERFVVAPVENIPSPSLVFLPDATPKPPPSGVFTHGQLGASTFSDPHYKFNHTPSFRLSPPSLVFHPTEPPRPLLVFSPTTN